MTSTVIQIREELERAGWTFRDDIPISQLDGLLSCSYAALGLLVAESVRDAVDRWTACQAEIASLRSNAAIGTERDLYLLIVLPELDAAAMNLIPPIINDTHVCRKLILELKGRRISEALDDIPFVAMEFAPAEAPVGGDTPIHSVALRLSDILLFDLATRSPSKVLDSLLADAYMPESGDAN